MTDTILTILKFAFIGLFALIILLPTLVGLVRGWKKSLFRFAWTAVITVVLIFVAGAITKMLFDINLPFLPSNEGYPQSIHGYIDYTINSNEQLAGLCSSSPIFTEFIDNAPLLICNVIVFELLFWVLKWLLWPVYAIIAHFVCKYKTDDDDKPKKHRLIGGLVGLLMGVFVAATTFMPLVGLNDVVMKLENTKVDSGNSALTEILGENASEYKPLILSFNDNMITPVLRYTGIEFADRAVFDYLTTIKAGGASTNLRKLADQASKVYSDVNFIMNFDYATATKATMTGYLTHLENIVNALMDDPLWGGLVQGVASYGIDYFTETPDFDEMLAGYNLTDRKEDVVEHLSNIGDLTATELKGEILNLIGIAKTMNSTELLATIVRGETSDIHALTQLYPEDLENFAQSLSTSINNLKVVKEIFPIAMEIGVNMMCDYFSIEQNITVSNDYDDYKESISEIISAALDISALIDESNNIEINSDTLVTVGALIDTIKDSEIMSGTDFNVLVESALENVVEEMLPDNDFTPIITALIPNITQITSFESDLKILGKAFDTISAEYNPDEDLSLSQIGSWLDLLKGSELVKKSLGTLADTIADMFIDESVVTDENIRNTLKDVINNIQQVENFEEELTNIESIYNQIKGLSNLSFDSIKPLVDDIDTLIDGGSKLLTHEVVNKLLKSVVNGLEIDAKYASITDLIAANVDNMTAGKKYADEVEFIQNVLDAINNENGLQVKDLFNKEHEKSILDVDGNSKSVLIDNKVIKQMMTVTIDEVEVEEKYQGIVDVVKDHLDNLEQLGEIMDEVQYVADNLDSLTSGNIEDMGETLNELVENTTDLLGTEGVKDLADAYLDSAIQDAMTSEDTEKQEKLEQAKEELQQAFESGGDINYQELIEKYFPKNV